MPTPIDDQGAYRVVLPFDLLAELGFSAAGARELRDARPLSLSADRQRLATVLAAREWPVTGQLLRERGFSALGAEQIVRAVAVTDYRDRLRVAGVLGRLASRPSGTAALEVYDYPGEYSGRFDGVD